MFVKICGIRDVETALMAAQAGADAIGLNFYDQSPRVVAPEIAADTVNRLRQIPGRTVEPVGVFVNQRVDEIRTISRQCRLRTVQLHGDETPEQVAELAGEFRIVRAFHVGEEGLDPLAEFLNACQQLGATLWACLIDAKVVGKFGGTGQTAPWDLLQRDYQTADWPPLILAGGLRPDNVSEAIRVVGPWGVDVAGGVESSVACKDARLVRQFVQNAKVQT
jgi:phosphoribosylanthranilate isomerase